MGSSRARDIFDFAPGGVAQTGHRALVQIIFLKEEKTKQNEA